MRRWLVLYFIELVLLPEDVMKWPVWSASCPSCVYCSPSAGGAESGWPEDAAEDPDGESGRGRQSAAPCPPTGGWCAPASSQRPVDRSEPDSCRNIRSETVSASDRRGAEISFCLLCFWFLLLFVSSDDVGKPTVSSAEEEDEALETMRFNFNIESLGLVLYSNDPKQVSQNRTAAPWRRFSYGSGTCVSSVLIQTTSP